MSQSQDTNVKLTIPEDGGLELRDESQDDAWVWTDDPRTVKR